MSLVPLFHPLSGQGGVLEDIAPNSPRDAWAWLAQRPGLARRAGVNHILAHSPSSRLHVLYLTPDQISTVERGARVGVLCAWAHEFDAWQPGHDVVLENGDVRLQYSLRSIRYFVSQAEMMSEMHAIADSGISLVTDRPPPISADSESDPEPSPEPEPEGMGIPIPSRGLRHMQQMRESVYVGVLLELTPNVRHGPDDSIIH
jgi:hypothetical protein